MIALKATNLMNQFRIMLKKLNCTAFIITKNLSLYFLQSNLKMKAFLANLLKRICDLIMPRSIAVSLLEST